jgi:hypothetical protein
MAPIGTTFFVCTAFDAPVSARTCRIGLTIGVVAVGRSVAVVIYSVSARACFVRRRRTAVLRAIAHILIPFARAIAAERRSTAIYLAIVAVLRSLTGAVAAAIGDKWFITGIPFSNAPGITTIYRIDTVTIATAEALGRFAGLFSRTIIGTRYAIFSEICFANAVATAPFSAATYAVVRAVVAVFYRITHAVTAETDKLSVTIGIVTICSPIAVIINSVGA